MAPTSRTNQIHPDLENFPLSRDPSDDFSEIVAMPGFIKDEELRKGPRQQKTLAWMNAVQAHLDESTSWDRRLNGTIALRVHKEPKDCQAARIFPRSTETRRLIKKPKYIKDELQPAIRLLVEHEQKSKKDSIKPEPHDNDKKRTREEDAEIHQAAKRRKQDSDKKLTTLVDKLQLLRKLVDEKMGSVDIQIRQEFHKLEVDILELLTAEF